MHHQGVGLAAQDGDVLEILDRVVAQLRLGQRVGQVAALGGDHQRIAIGLAARHRLRGDRAAGARAVVDDHRHTEDA